MKFIARLCSKQTGEVYGGDFETESFETAEADALVKFENETLITIYPDDHTQRVEWSWWISEKRRKDAEREDT
jgi:hypothetical protein